MDWRRLFLFIGLTGIIYFVYLYVYLFPYQKKVEEYRKQQLALRQAETEATTGTRAVDGTTTGGVPRDIEPTSPTTVADQVRTTPTMDGEASTVTVETSLYRVVFTTRGGRPASWTYFDRVPGRTQVGRVEMIPQRADLSEAKRELPLELIFKENNRRWYTEFNNRVYDHEVRQLDEGSTEVVFTSPEIRRLQVTKTYRFRRDDYLTSFRVVLQNHDEKATVRANDDGNGLGISWGPGIRELPPGKTMNMRFCNAVFGREQSVGHSKPNNPKNEAKRGQFDGDVFWAGVTDTYFLAAVIPDGFKGSAVRTFVRRNNVLPKPTKQSSFPFTIALYNDRFDLPPGGRATLNYNIFVGPKRPRLLADVGERTGTKMKNVLFYDYWFRWMRAIKLGLMYTLNFLFSLLGNYGISIVIMTVLIRLIMHPLAHKGMKIQTKAMAEMQKIKPLLDEVNKKYKGDPAKRNQEMMALYREHGISPLAPLRGCLPMLIQIPIFFALYDLLYQSIDLRGASFLWIDDLSGPDKLVDLAKHGITFLIPLIRVQVASLNLLPILMGVSQYIMSRMTPTPTTDSSQKQMMMIFTFMFPVLLYNFPSGLFLYWLINNVWQSTHQIITKRGLSKSPEKQATTTK